jgi:hypothetical protein
MCRDVDKTNIEIAANQGSFVSIQGCCQKFPIDAIFYKVLISGTNTSYSFWHYNFPEVECPHLQFFFSNLSRSIGNFCPKISNKWQKKHYCQYFVVVFSVVNHTNRSNAGLKGEKSLLISAQRHKPPNFQLSARSRNRKKYNRPILRFMKVE